MKWKQCSNIWKQNSKLDSFYEIVFLTIILQKATIKLWQYACFELCKNRRGWEDQFSISFVANKGKCKFVLSALYLLFCSYTIRKWPINLSLSSESSNAELSPRLYFLFDPSLNNIIFSLVCILQTAFCILITLTDFYNNIISHQSRGAQWELAFSS